MTPAAWLPFGSITDVRGIEVGHHQRTGRGWQTGTTVVYSEGGVTPGVAVLGGGPGTRETEAIAPDTLVQQINAICLTGGSAYGLAASHGVMDWLAERGLGVPMGTDAHHVVPVVPGAVIFDLARGGSFTNRPDATFGVRAITDARRRQARWGSVGAGTGAKAGGLQGGVGTASRVVTIDIPGAIGDPGRMEVTVGALAVANPNGSVIDPASGLPWEPSGLRLRRPPADQRRALREQLTGQAASLLLNTTIGVVATSARLDKAEAGKLAAVAHDGLARAVRPAHSMFDGDTVFALATGEHELPGASGVTHSLDGSRQAAINQLLIAAADTFAAACTHAVLAATTVGQFRAYRDVCPAAFSLR